MKKVIHHKDKEKIEVFPEYKQNDNKIWSNITYHHYEEINDKEKDSIAETGCGPTSLAIIITGLLRNTNYIEKALKELRKEVKEYNSRHKKEFKIRLCMKESVNNILTPDEAVAMATLTNSKEEGLGAGSYDEVFENIIKKYFNNILRVRQISINDVKKYLEKDKVLAVHTEALNRGTQNSKRSIFTETGHYITLIGIEKIANKDYIIVDDPYKQEYSNENMKQGDFIKPNRFKLEAVIDPKRGNCDKFWLIDIKKHIN